MLASELSQGVAVVTMDRPPANALNTALLTALGEAHRAACRDGARAMVLAGRPGMFSAGLDVPELLPQPRAAIHAFWQAFFGLTHALATSPIPVVAALGGHAPAGGAVLAIHCDYRIAAAGAFKIGFNEVAVGLPVPESILRTLQHVVGPRLAQRIAMSAQMLSMEEALAIGLVDELVAPEAVIGRARDWATGLLALPPLAMNYTRTLARAALVAGLQPEIDAERATGYWFSAETQAGMRNLVERLARK